MHLPPYEPNLVPEGHYIFEIDDNPEKRWGPNGGIYLIFKFRITSEEGETRNCSDVFVPWEKRYKDLLVTLGAEKDERGMVHLDDIELIGKQFKANIVHVRDNKDPEEIRAKIKDIKKIDDDVPPPGGGDEELPF